MVEMPLGNARHDTCVPLGLLVTYAITAEDRAGNTTTSEELGYECQYIVVPEPPPPVMLALLMTATLLALALPREKNRQTSLNFELPRFSSGIFFLLHANHVHDAVCVHVSRTLVSCEDREVFSCQSPDFGLVI